MRIKVKADFAHVQFQFGILLSVMPVSSDDGTVDIGKAIQIDLPFCYIMIHIYKFDIEDLTEEQAREMGMYD